MINLTVHIRLHMLRIVSKSDTKNVWTLACVFAKNMKRGTTADPALNSQVRLTTHNITMANPSYTKLLVSRLPISFCRLAITAGCNEQTGTLGRQAGSDRNLA